MPADDTAKAEIRHHAEHLAMMPAALSHKEKSYYICFYTTICCLSKVAAVVYNDPMLNWLKRCGCQPYCLWQVMQPACHVLAPWHHGQHNKSMTTSGKFSILKLKQVLFKDLCGDLTINSLKYYCKMSTQRL